MQTMQKKLVDIEENDMNIEIVQRTNMFDSIVSVYSKKEDVTIISTPEDIHLQASFHKDSDQFANNNKTNNHDEDENDQEFEMCGVNFEENSEDDDDDNATNNNNININ